MARRVQGRTTWARTRGMCASPLAMVGASGPATGCAHAVRVCATTPVATGGATCALVDTLLVASGRHARFVTQLGDGVD